MSEPFAGVDLNQVQPAGSENAPDTNTVSAEPTAENQSTPISTQAPASELVDLDKLDRVRFGGKELTLKELRDSYMRQSDYTKKTKEIAETRKYAENFVYDFEKVVANPSLLAEFKRIYPAQYVERVEAYLSKQQQQTPSAEEQVSSGEGGISPEVQKLLEERLKPFEEKLTNWETSVKEQETKAIGAQLDALHSQFEKKYPYADPDLVDFRVQVAKEKGVEITKDNLSHVYEQVYKSLHESHEKRLNEKHALKVKEQVKAGQRAKDVSGGTGIPGAAPKKYSKFSDITKDALAAFGGK